ncbi:hypothetical protein BDW74DRAFT_158836 [Aspergillus multicolor]|uniref:uncharacterized protein n=1 Tax=Aspergillus multicolor TaxID=41759 RepID=UPI003CCE12D8
MGRPRGWRGTSRIKVASTDAGVSSLAAGASTASVALEAALGILMEYVWGPINVAITRQIRALV